MLSINTVNHCYCSDGTHHTYSSRLEQQCEWEWKRVIERESKRKESNQINGCTLEPSKVNNQRNGSSQITLLLFFFYIKERSRATESKNQRAQQNSHHLSYYTCSFQSGFGWQKLFKDATTTMHQIQYKFGLFVCFFFPPCHSYNMLRTKYNNQTNYIERMHFAYD